MFRIFSYYIDYIKDNPKGYWFKARLFGWGWTPATWQGFVVLLTFIMAIFLNTYRIDRLGLSEEEAAFVMMWQTGLMVVLLIAICIKKGEKPRWQWGKPRKV